jgi:hypothetical protein
MQDSRRPDLTTKRFAAVLSALATTALAGCAGVAPQPVQANAVGAGTLAPSATSSQTGAATPAESSSGAAPAKPTASQPAPMKASSSNAEASCGAGSCGGDTKSKIW